MPNYRVKVKVIAEVEYEVEVEASSYAKAEDAAAAMWREKTPSDFQVDKGYITKFEIDSEQSSWECDRCGAVMRETEYYSETSDGHCAECARAEAAA